jgi:hypothetical protein
VPLGFLTVDFVNLRDLIADFVVVWGRRFFLAMFLSTCFCRRLPTQSAMYDKSKRAYILPNIAASGVALSIVWYENLIFRAASVIG